jgi:hypothetical protein
MIELGKNNMVKWNQHIWHESLEGDSYSINIELTKLTKRYINWYFDFICKNTTNLEAWGS